MEVVFDLDTVASQDSGGSTVSFYVEVVNDSTTLGVLHREDIFFLLSVSQVVKLQWNLINVNYRGLH